MDKPIRPLGAQTGPRPHLSPVHVALLPTPAPLRSLSGNWYRSQNLEGFELPVPRAVMIPPAHRAPPEGVGGGESGRWANVGRYDPV